MSDFLQQHEVDIVNPTSKSPLGIRTRSGKRGTPGVLPAGHARQTGNAEEKPTLQGKIRRWIAEGTATGLGISLIVHLLLFFAFSLYIIRSDKTEEFVLSSNVAAEEDLDLEELYDVTMDVPKASDSPEQPNLMQDQPTELIATPAFLKNNSGEKVGEQFGFRVPTGGNVVSKGSFTAWTIPEDPEPRQDYLIIIQIKLPPKIKKYRKEDLSGFLTGDDGYTTPIGEYRGSKFPQKYYGKFDMKAKQFVIKIPGAAAKVKDEILIQSRMLKEKQKLVIVF